MAATAVTKQLRAAIQSVPVLNKWTPRQQALLEKLMGLFKKAVNAENEVCEGNTLAIIRDVVKHFPASKQQYALAVIGRALHDATNDLLDSVDPKKK